MHIRDSYQAAVISLTGYPVAVGDEMRGGITPRIALQGAVDDGGIHVHPHPVRDAVDGVVHPGLGMVRIVPDRAAPGHVRAVERGAVHVIRLDADQGVRRNTRPSASSTRRR